MIMENTTDFHDKSGKQIYIGDTLQIRLGKFAKKGGGPMVLKVIRFGKNIQLIDPNDIERKYGGAKLTQQRANYSVIIDREIFR